MFDDFSIWLLGYRIEFSCLYLPQGHKYCVAMKYRWICQKVYSERKSIFRLLTGESLINAEEEEIL